MDKYTFQVNFNLTVTCRGDEDEAREKALYVLRKFIISPEAIRVMRRFMKLIEQVPQIQKIESLSSDPIDEEARELARLDGLQSADDFNLDIVQGRL